MDHGTHLHSLRPIMHRLRQGSPNVFPEAVSRQIAKIATRYERSYCCTAVLLEKTEKKTRYTASIYA